MKPNWIALLMLSAVIISPLSAENERVLMGRWMMENGKPIFMLRAPIDMDGRSVSKLAPSFAPSVTEKPDSNSDSDVFIIGTLGADTGKSSPSFAVTNVISAASLQSSDALSTTIFSENKSSDSSNSKPSSVTNTTNISITTNKSVTKIELTAPQSESGLSRFEETLVGRWSMAGPTNSITAIPHPGIELGGSFGKQVVFDLAKDRTAAFTVSASEPLGSEAAATILGTWCADTMNGQPILMIEVRELTGNGNPFGKDPVPKAVRWWIKHAGAGTLILREDCGLELRLAK